MPVMPPGWANVTVAAEVVFSPEAAEDLLNLYDYIADSAGEARALAFVQTIRVYCMDFAIFPQRGTRRDDLRPGLRVTGFRRRITLAFHVAPGRIVISMPAAISTGCSSPRTIREIRPMPDIPAWGEGH